MFASTVLKFILPKNMRQPARPSRRRVGTLTLCTSLLVALTACAPQSQDEALEGVDPEIIAALEEEPAITFTDESTLEDSLQAELMVSIITTLGGEANTQVSDPAASLTAMAEGDSIVMMYFWPWQHEAAWEKYYEEEEAIISIGTSDYQGEHGWYVPTYVVEGDEERGIEPMCPELPAWEGLNDCVDLFTSAQTEPMGQYMTGAQSWGDAYGDQKRIDNLGLDYEIVYAGSQASLMSEITRAYEQGEPWLGLMWRPNYLTLTYDLTRVEFPEHDEECWGDTYACQFPEGIIHRASSVNVPEDHPTVYHILENYDLNDDQLQELQEMVLEDGMEVKEAAETWVKENTEVWQRWL